MIDRATALLLAQGYVDGLRGFAPGDLLVTPEHVIEAAFGWVVPYDSRRWVEHHDWDARLTGNVPVIVHRADGALAELGGRGPLPERAAAYKREWLATRTAPSEGRGR